MVVCHHQWASNLINSFLIDGSELDTVAERPTVDCSDVNDSDESGGVREFSASFKMVVRIATK